MKTLSVLLIAALVTTIFFLSEDRFFMSGGSDISEQLFQVSRTMRIIAAVAFVVSVAWLFTRPSALTTPLAVAGLAAFLLSQNTVRISGKSFEVVQSFALVPVTRIPVTEGEGDLTGALFLGVTPISLPESEIRKALTGLTRH